MFSRKTRELTMKSHRSLFKLFSIAVLVVALPSAGCGSGSRTNIQLADDRSRMTHEDRDPIRKLVCLYDPKPWLNLDMAGDQDPEGIHYRVYLDSGSGIGVHRDGKFYVQMYQINRTLDGLIDRKLVSDWHVTTHDAQTLESSLLGYGYHLMFRWASKSIAGNEVEIITVFEDVHGRSVRSGTKRFRVPKYNT